MLADLDGYGIFELNVLFVVVIPTACSEILRDQRREVDVSAQALIKSQVEGRALSAYCRSTTILSLRVLSIGQVRKVELVQPGRTHHPCCTGLRTRHRSA